MTPRTAGALRLLGVGAIVGLTTGAVIGATGWRPPSPAPAGARLALTSAAPTLVCPGAQTLQVPPGGEPLPAGPTVIAAVAGTGAAPGTGDGAPAGRLGRLDRPAAGGGAELRGRPAGVLRARIADAQTDVAQAGPLRLDVARTAAGTVPAVAATQLALTRTGDLRGLSVTACAPATAGGWLVGGGTGTGRRARLLLANPAAAPAVVDLDLRGPTGRVDSPAGNDLLVPPGGSRVLFLDALAPGLEQLAVRVVARSGRVSATLHDEVVRGLVAGGTDGVTAAAAPSRRQLVPGLVLTDEPADDLPTPAVRVVVPGTADAIVRVRLLGPDGPFAPAGAVRSVPAGSVADLPLVDVPPGTWTAVVEADVPVVAAGLLTRTGDPGPPADELPAEPASELAWAPSTDRLTGLVALAVPPGSGVGKQVVLGAPAAAAVDLWPVGPDGRPGRVRQVVLDAAGTRAVPLPDDAYGALLRVGRGDVHAAVVFTMDDPAGPMVAVAPVRATAVARAAPRAVQDPSAGLVRPADLGRSGQPGGSSSPP